MNHTQPDHTEIEKLRRENALLRKELDDFVYSVSHDLNAPIRGIMNLSTWIQEAVTENRPQELPDYLKLLNLKSQDLRLKLEGLVSLSRVMRKEYDSRKFHPAETLNRLKAESPFREHPGIQLSIGHTTICGREELFMEASRQLLMNAVEHAEASSPSIKVEGHETPSAFELAISHNGSPVPEEKRETVFQLFRTLHPENGKGGVGLTIVKKISEIVAGKISMEDRPGIGMVTVLKWPLSETPCAGTD